MKIYLATWFEDAYGSDLTKSGAKNRLVSYFGCLRNNVDAKRLKEYIKKGIFSKAK